MLSLFLFNLLCSIALGVACGSGNGGDSCNNCVAQTDLWDSCIWCEANARCNSALFPPSCSSDWQTIDDCVPSQTWICPQCSDAKYLVCEGEIVGCGFTISPPIFGTTGCECSSPTPCTCSKPVLTTTCPACTSISDLSCAPPGEMSWQSCSGDRCTCTGSEKCVCANPVKPVECTSNAPLPYVFYRGDNGNTYLEGDTRTVYCWPGYENRNGGTMQLTCLANGQWTSAPTGSARCTQIPDSTPVIGCTSNAPPPYIFYPGDNGNTYLEGDTRTVYCRSGYENRNGGTMQLTCLANGQWTSAPIYGSERCTLIGVPVDNTSINENDQELVNVMGISVGLEILLIAIGVVVVVVGGIGGFLYYRKRQKSALLESTYTPMDSLQ